MALGEKIRKIILAIGDLVCFYLSLFLMATIRHLNADYFYRVVGGFLYRPSL